MYRSGFSLVDVGFAQIPSLNLASHKRGFLLFPILHRANQRQEYFASSEVKSVANNAALVGPAALSFSANA